VHRLAAGGERVGRDQPGIVVLAHPAGVAIHDMAHALGALSLGLYRDALEDEVQYLLAFAEVKAVIAEASSSAITAFTSAKASRYWTSSSSASR
jgi:long-subunit acyl-CoA synthetase (AMP-forming)